MAILKRTSGLRGREHGGLLALRLAQALPRSSHGSPQAQVRTSTACSSHFPKPLLLLTESLVAVPERRPLSMTVEEQCLHCLDQSP